MIGRELILYILENKLENEVVLRHGIFDNLLDIEGIALDLGVGEATVKTWCKYGMFDNTVLSKFILLKNGGNNE